MTGAGRRVGCAAAIALAQAAARVAVKYRSEEQKALGTVHAIISAGSCGTVAQADVSRSIEVTSMVKAIERDLGPVEILINNAGIIRPQAERRFVRRTGMR